MKTIKNLGIWQTVSKNGCSYLSVQVKYYIDNVEIQRNYRCFDKNNKYESAKIESATINNILVSNDELILYFNKDEGCIDCIVSVCFNSNQEKFIEKAYKNLYKTEEKHPDFKIKDKKFGFNKAFEEFLKSGSVNDNEIKPHNDTNLDTDIINSEIEAGMKRYNSPLSDDYIPEQESDNTDLPS